MNQQRYYLDNSVLEGYKDEVRGEITDEFFNQLKLNNVHLTVDKLIYNDLKFAKGEISELLLAHPVESLEYLPFTSEAEILATEYILAKIVGKEMLPICRQLALAAIHKADVFVSWNYVDIVNVVKIQEFNRVNIRKGYMPLEIRSPKDYLYARSAMQEKFVTSDQQREM
jgi:hypothetical protein